ncbi:MAG: tRNA uridine-5-carboxymethylaminomethyl(34) synthesis GTPase MnmE [Candidatus Krumholzibacteriota bacterium]|nr:tRNA uridine-5-carboxymethylaminomethyl(34) synthesis GTPase MnmE [Candidatus Krumholzibacteriota bacterium]
MYGDTVVALSTPPGESGIAVVRMSGREAVKILSGMIPDAHTWETHKIHKRKIRGTDGNLIDEVLAVIMRAPDSYTGEDVVEISCHGSMLIITELIEELIARGAVVAGPGEFTKKAYLNGKIDLVQAEAVADLIAAETRLQSLVALEHLGGGLSRKVREVEDKLLEQLSLVEVSIDFSQEDIETWSAAELTEVSREIRKKLRSLIESEVAGKKLRRGIRITLLGPRNAGKSSLYNALLGEERAIVSSIPGTTRDLLRERIHIGGFTFYLEDTAGIAETGCEIENRGISIGREAARIADLVLFVIDGNSGCEAQEERELARMGHREVIVVLNKKDLGLREDESKVSVRLGGVKAVALSAKEGEGLDKLREEIFSRAVMSSAADLSRERIALNARQAASLAEAERTLEKLEREMDKGAEILSLYIREALEACGRVTGRAAAEELLDTIFNRFCIGK